LRLQNTSRRDFLTTASSVLAALAAAGSRAAELGQPRVPDWNHTAFEAKTLAEAFQALGIATVQGSGELDLVAPEIAEDGAVVPVIVHSRAAGTREIHILVDKNPFSLAASFFLPDGTDAFVSTRIRMNETSNVVVVAVTDRQVYLARTPVKVTIGGCGG
jgi:sulfur-oxidizing protein SoxY